MNIDLGSTKLLSSVAKLVGEYFMENVIIVWIIIKFGTNIEQYSLKLCRRELVFINIPASPKLSIHIKEEEVETSEDTFVKRKILLRVLSKPYK